MARGTSLRRGQIWWARLPPPARNRPVVLASRQEAYASRQLLIVAPVTTRSRGIRAEVPLGPADGLPRACVANCDTLRTISRRALLEPIGSLREAKIADLDTALKFALGLD